MRGLLEQFGSKNLLLISDVVQVIGDAIMPQLGDEIIIAGDLTVTVLDVDYANSDSASLMSMCSTNDGELAGVLEDQG